MGEQVAEVAGSSDQRNHLLDALRVPACWTNYWYHATLGGAGAVLPGAISVNTIPVFLVLGGFLGTRSLIKRNLDPDKPLQPVRSTVDRAKRLFPVLYVYVPVAMVLNVLLGITTPLYSLLGAIGTFTGTLNMMVAAGLPAGATGHLWYISADLQFHLLWAAVLLYLVRHSRDWVRSALWLCAPGIVLSALIRAAVFTGGESGRWAFAHETLPARLDSFLFGAAAALALHRWGKPRIPGWMPALFALWVLLTAPVLHLPGVTMTADFAFEANYTILNFGWTVIVVWAFCLPAVERKRFEVRPVQWLSKVSYSWYVWHLPISAVGYVLDIPLYVSAPFGLVISTVLAWLSWRYIEVPAMARSRSGGRRRRLQRSPQLTAAT